MAEEQSLAALLTEEDFKQAESRGIAKNELIDQFACFQKGNPPVKLDRPARLKDGIVTIPKEQFKTLEPQYLEAAREGRVGKFVPASGAATRMFKELTVFYNAASEIRPAELIERTTGGDAAAKAFLYFMNGLKKFAFFDALKEAAARQNHDLNALLANGNYKEVLELLLNERGLNYGNLPKALIPFHRYQDHVRTPLEEHLIEGMTYLEDKLHRIRVHFTVSAEHEDRVSRFVKDLARRYADTLGAKFEISLSSQQPSTDTIAVDPEHKPFRDADGKLVFRPAGHGALLNNLANLGADLVFVRNIDNVICDRLKLENFAYKKALGGYLIELQKKVFYYLEKLETRAPLEPKMLKEILRFSQEKLFIAPPKNWNQLDGEAQKKFFMKILNRPIRVAGMVKNAGEPGGGPFWVLNDKGERSLQIVELHQIARDDEAQQKILSRATHFNPVDMVLGLKDYKGNAFKLEDFTDPGMFSISQKSFDGRPLKALERPGLWNGGMADWITVFVEIPLALFNPVKTVHDLLRKEHCCNE